MPRVRFTLLQVRSISTLGRRAVQIAQELPCTSTGIGGTSADRSGMRVV